MLKAEEGGAAERLALQESDFDLIEPGRACRREMKSYLGVLLEPTLVLLVRVEIAQDDVKLAVGKCCDDVVHEADKFAAAAPFRMHRDDLPGGAFRSPRIRLSADFV